MPPGTKTYSHPHPRKGRRGRGRGRSRRGTGHRVRGRVCVALRARARARERLFERVPARPRAFSVPEPSSESAAFRPVAIVRVGDFQLDLKFDVNIPRTAGERSCWHINLHLFSLARPKLKQTLYIVSQCNPKHSKLFYCPEISDCPLFVILYRSRPLFSPAR